MLHKGPRWGKSRTDRPPNMAVSRLSVSPSHTHTHPVLHTLRFSTVLAPPAAAAPPAPHLDEKTPLSKRQSGLPTAEMSGRRVRIRDRPVLKHDEAAASLWNLVDALVLGDCDLPELLP